MSSKPRFRCDCCGKDFESREGLYQVDIHFSKVSSSSTRYSEFRIPGPNVATKDICPECQAKLGLTEWLKSNSSQLPPSVSFEDLLREMVQEEIVNAGSR